VESTCFLIIFALIGLAALELLDELLYVVYAPVLNVDASRCRFTELTEVFIFLFRNVLTEVCLLC
jgi:hypothetical protein